LNSVRQSWNIIEGVLRTELPEVYATLAPPATRQAIATLSAAFTYVKLPAAFIESLQIHDGQIDPQRLLPLFDYQHLLSASQILETYQMLQGIFPDEPTVNHISPTDCHIVRRNRIWSSRWIPFTESNGDALVLDFDPASKGIAGQVFFRPNSDNPPDKALAPNFSHFLDGFAQRMASGAFEIKAGALTFADFTFNF